MFCFKGRAMTLRSKSFDGATCGVFTYSPFVWAFRVSQMLEFQFDKDVIGHIYTKSLYSININNVHLVKLKAPARKPPDC